MEPTLSLSIIAIKYGMSACWWSKGVIQTEKTSNVPLALQLSQSVTPPT